MTPLEIEIWFSVRCVAILEPYFRSINFNAAMLPARGLNLPKR
jgi:hypothetical protein